MAQITHYKSLQKDILTKDPNFEIFLNTSGRVTETYQIKWPRVYSIFDNVDFSNIQNDQSAYQRIRDSRHHAIASKATILPYNDTVK